MGNAADKEQKATMADDDFSVGVVSLCVIARNEEEYLPSLLEDIEHQTFPHDRIEVVLVDSDSEDGTLDIMRQFAADKSAGFCDVILLSNPKRILPAGWNVAINGSSGDVLLRVDAHASIPSDFVEKSVETLESGEEVCGGIRPTIVKDSTPWRETLHLAEESAFGSGVAPYRRGTGPQYSSSVFHGAYRRQVFERVGGFDERLFRTEDNEMHYRIRKAGYRIRLNPEIRSRQYVRCSLRGMLKQKYSNGYWIGRTMYIEPHCFRPYHLVPLAFTLALIASGIFAFVSPVPLLGLLAVYVLTDLALSLKAIIESRCFVPAVVLLPVVFLLIHLSYGVGTLVGLLSGLVKPVKPARS